MPSALYTDGQNQRLVVQRRGGPQHQIYSVDERKPHGFGFYNMHPMPINNSGKPLSDLPAGEILSVPALDGFRNFDNFLASLSGLGNHILEVPRLTHIGNHLPWEGTSMLDGYSRETRDMPYAVMSVLTTSPSITGEHYKKRSVVFMNGGYLIITSAHVEEHHSEESGQSHIIGVEAKKYEPHRFDPSVLAQSGQVSTNSPLFWKFLVGEGIETPAEVQTHGDITALRELEKLVNSWFEALSPDRSQQF